MATEGRARVIYQSEALYASTVDATGHHYFACVKHVDDNDWGANKTGFAKLSSIPVNSQIRTGVEQLRRGQSANYSFSLNRQDVNQFGQLARIASVSIDPPTVSMDFSYYY